MGVPITAFECAGRGPEATSVPSEVPRILLLPPQFA